MSAILKQKLIDIANGFTKYGLWKGGGSGGSSALSEMTDVSFTDLQANDILKYNGNVWVNDDYLQEYSTEEKIVGTWIDGKPVYQRTFVDIPITSLNTLIYLTNEGNIKDLLFISGCSIRDGEPIPFGIFNISIYTTAIVRNNNLAVLMNGISGETYSIKNITIQYTKTTD